MDFSDPTRAVTPTLDGPVLAVLAAAGHPLTVGEVAAQAVRGSEIGVRRSLSRLIGQGVVRATRMGRNVVHELNRDHLAAGIAQAMASLRLELWTRLRKELSEWDPAPLYACAFGSAARGDGNVDSDVDVLVVHPIFPGDGPSERADGAEYPQSVAALEGALDIMTAFPVVQQSVGADPERWYEQIDGLHDLVQRWTGNPLQVIDLSYYEWRSRGGPHAALLAEIDRDGVELFKATAAMSIGDSIRA